MNWTCILYSIRCSLNSKAVWCLVKIVIVTGFYYFCFLWARCCVSENCLLLLDNAVWCAVVQLDTARDRLHVLIACSLVFSVLPADLMAEAHLLRGELEDRNRRLQNQIFPGSASLSSILRQTGNCSAHLSSGDSSNRKWCLLRGRNLTGWTCCDVDGCYVVVVVVAVTLWLCCLTMVCSQRHF